MFELHNSELIRNLSKRVEEIIAKFVDRMKDDHVKLTETLCSDFDGISRRALSTPKDTEELMALSEEIKAIRAPGGRMAQIEKELRHTKDRLLFLCGETQMAPRDVRLNSDVFTWPSRIEKVFLDHENIIGDKTSAYQEELKNRRSRFQEDLESYQRQLEEFKGFADPNQVDKYHQKAQKLQEKLDKALETIDQFNLEEEAYGWESSSYPLRNEVSQNLAPYGRLYETCATFVADHDKWLHGDMTKMNPDDIEQEVSATWRSLYKLEKELGDNPKAKSIATATKAIVDEFKENLPIISTICNPGLRERHWTKMAEIVGVENFAPDESRHVLIKSCPRSLSFDIFSYNCY